MPPKRPTGAGAFPIPVEPTRATTARSGRALCGAGSRHEQVPHADCPTQGQPVPCRGQLLEIGAVSGRGSETSGRLSRGSMARTVQALRICQRKLEQARGAPDAAGGDRGLSPRHQRPRVHRPCRARDRPGARDHQARGRGAAGRDLLRAAGLDQDRAAAGGRYRRRVDRTGLDRPQPGVRASTGHARSCGCTPASSRWTAARSPRRGWSTGSRSLWAWRRCASSSTTCATMRRASR